MAVLHINKDHNESLSWLYLFQDPLIITTDADTGSLKKTPIWLQCFKELLKSTGGWGLRAEGISHESFSGDPRKENWQNHKGSIWRKKRISVPGEEKKSIIPEIKHFPLIMYYLKHFADFCSILTANLWSGSLNCTISEGHWDSDKWGALTKIIRRLKVTQDSQHSSLVPVNNT